MTHRIDRRNPTSGRVGLPPMRAALAGLLMGLMGPAVAATVPLAAPAPAYPVLLNHACGGVHVSTFATGFDRDGHVTGMVYAWTRCPAGPGRYRHIRTYRAWHTVVWDAAGTVLSVQPSPPAEPDPAFTATDAAGRTIATRRIGEGNAAHYVAELVTP
jgi:hypothetical protein